MSLLSDRRLVVGAGAVLALTAGLIVAGVAVWHGPTSTAAPPASEAGLTVQTGRDEDIKLDPKRPLRCFVAGRLVGELPLGECARRNGVASGSLDVGLDPSGALAASNGDSAELTPLPPAQAAAPPSVQPETGASATSDAESAGPADVSVPANCWRYAAGAWNVLSRPMGLVACVQNLYDGQCEHPGGAAYGRWGNRTLRLVSGRIEISRDGHDFSTLVEQGEGCAVPSFR